MKHRILFQSLTRTEDGQGGFTEEWEDGDYVSAEVTPLKAWEQMRAQQLDSKLTHKILIRYRSDITDEMRLFHRGRIYGIKEVLNLEEANRYLQLMCMEESSAVVWEYIEENWEDINNVNWENWQ
jgi:SPP1 family predicted phage head-tail adaptor